MTQTNDNFAFSANTEISPALSKKTEITSPKTKTTNSKKNINQHAYLHPQNIEPRTFIPSSIVLKPLLGIPGSKCEERLNINVSLILYSPDQYCDF